MVLLGEVIEKTWVPRDLWAGPGLLEAPSFIPCPWAMGSAYLSHCQRLLQEHRLEIVMWYWKHLQSIHDWTQLRPLYKLWGSGGQGEDSLVLLQPKTSVLGKFPLFKTATYEPGVACLFLRSLPALHVRGPVTDFTWKASQEGFWTNRFANIYFQPVACFFMANILNFVGV